MALRPATPTRSSVLKPYWATSATRTTSVERLRIRRIHWIERPGSITWRVSTIPVNAQIQGTKVTIGIPPFLWRNYSSRGRPSIDHCVVAGSTHGPLVG